MPFGEAWAKLVQEIIVRTMSEDQLPAVIKAHKLSVLNKEGHHAVDNNDIAELRRVAAELERLSVRP